MIKLAEELNRTQSRFYPTFYYFLCDSCQDILYIMPILLRKGLFNAVEENVNLCRACYKDKTEKELSQIARLSSEIVIKEMAKMNMHTQLLEDNEIKKKEEDSELRDLKKYLEFKLLFQ